MATNAEMLAAVRREAARELYQILSKAQEQGSSPYDNPSIAQYVAVAQAADIAAEVMHEFDDPKGAISEGQVPYDPSKY